METEEEVIEIESLENSNKQFPIYKTKTGRKFIGLYKILNDIQYLDLGSQMIVVLGVLKNFLRELESLGICHQYPY